MEVGVDIMAKIQKTNAMRILDKKNIKYSVFEYDVSDGNIDGISVTQKLGQDPNCVFKTLVTISGSRKNYVFVIPVNCELDLKKAAKACGEKSIEMIHVADILNTTGYIRGGCSPVGMKKQFPTFYHITAGDMPNIIVSGGKKGYQIQLRTNELIEVTNGKLADITQ